MVIKKAYKKSASHKYFYVELFSCYHKCILYGTRAHRTCCEKRNGSIRLDIISQIKYFGSFYQSAVFLGEDYVRIGGMR